MTRRQSAKLIFYTYLLQAAAVCIAAIAIWLSMQPQGNDAAAVFRTCIDFAIVWICCNAFMRQAALRDQLIEADRHRGPWSRS
jgi:hypothetical protein